MAEKIENNKDNQTGQVTPKKYQVSGVNLGSYLGSLLV
jgi:hypothetical protein